MESVAVKLAKLFVVVLRFFVASPLALESEWLSLALYVVLECSKRQIVDV